MSIKRTQQVDPELQSLLEDERKYEKQTAFKFNQVKIPKGHSWLLRYLPIPVDPVKGLPFLRIARHWVNKKPHNCPRHSSPSIGGNTENACAACDAADPYANSGNETVKREARLLQGTPRFLTYCLVLAREDDRQRREDVEGSELWTPYEHWIPKGAFSDWLNMFTKGSTKSKHSICDWRKGNDIWVTADRNMRLTLDKEDSSPIIDTDDDVKFKKIVKKITSAIKFPSFEMADEDALEQAADKIKDTLEDLSEGSSSRSSRRRATDDDEEDAPRSRRSRSSDDEDDEDAKPSRRRSAPAEDEDEDEDEDEAPKSKKKAASDDEEDEDDIDYTHPDKDKKKKPSAAVDDEDEEDEDEEDEEDDDDDEDEELPKGKAKSKPTPKGKDVGGLDEEDDVADEDEDQAPAKKTKIDDDEDEEEEEEGDDDEDAPPKVSAKGSSGDLDKVIRKRVGAKR